MQQREILFRGKRNDGKEFDGQWVNGFCAYADDLDVEINVVLNDWAAEESVCLFDTIVCDRATLGQYTGLQDVNGVKIFEGDVLQSVNGIAYVVWDGTGFAMKSPGSEAVDWHPSAYYKTMEIIGNIHDNPELISQ